MKRILLACCLLALTGSAAIAQTAKTDAPAQGTTASATDAKLLFSSKINDLDASLSRKNNDQAQKSTQDLLMMMTTRMNQNQDSKSPAAKTLQKLYSQAKVLAVDPVKNHTALVETLHQFLQAY